MLLIIINKSRNNKVRIIILQRASLTLNIKLPRPLQYCKSRAPVLIEFGTLVKAELLVSSGCSSYNDTIFWLYRAMPVVVPAFTMNDGSAALQQQCLQ